MKKIVVITIVIVIVILCIVGYIYYQTSLKSNVIPNNYIAVFYGGSGEITHSTYIYKIENGHANVGFKYINTENTTKSYGSSDWIIKKIGEGKVTWTEEVFKVAEENNAYSYVKLPDDKKTYTIEEFQRMFLMD